MNHHLPMALAMSLFAVPGFAGGLSDPIIPAPIPAPPPIVQPNDWYIGLQVGPARGDLTPEIPDTAFPETEADGNFYGVHAGVQRSFGAITAGLEIDYNTASDALGADDNVVEADFDTLAHLKVRAGANFGPAFIYGTAGLAYASGVIESFGIPVDVSDTAPFYGIGTDVMVSESISIGAEVLVHDFEDMDDTGVDVDFTTAMLRVSYHF
jgi:outer membrane immunogenic protein